jgi:hypothetical protein
MADKMFALPCKTLIRLFILVGFMLLAACSGVTPIPATPTASPAPTFTPQPTSTATTLPTNTTPPTQTDTPPPTLTSTPLPTFTPQPTATLTQEPPSETPTDTATAAPQTVVQAASSQYILKYLVHLGTGGPFGCGDSLYPASTGILRTDSVVENVRLLLSNLFAGGSQYIGDFFNPVYQAHLNVNDIKYTKSTGGMIVYLSGGFSKPKDNCGKLRYHAQVWESVYQFSEIKRVDIWVNNKLMGDLLELVPEK